MTYHEYKNEWAIWFLAADNKDLLCLLRKSFNHDQICNGTYLNQLKTFECYTRTDMNPCSDSDFHLRIFDF